ncbi:MAG: methylmalonyl-CoA mutase subunit beta [Flavobacteriaceae bacterium]|nr:methylmalonyl-CoA mutase subunit beta [Flavobacteriaceae bacterium]
MSNSITNDFDTVSAAAWKQKIQVDLKGADYNKTLLTQTNEGITIKPFYHADDFEKLTITTQNTDLNICEKIWVSFEKKANKKALDVLNRGANSIKFTCTKHFDFTVLFHELLHKKIEFHFDFHFYDTDFILELSDFLSKETVFYNLDFIGHLAAKGNWIKNQPQDIEQLKKILTLRPRTNIISVNTAIYQNAGANTVQQVAYALAHANEYLSAFGGEIAPYIQFNNAIGSNYFFEIAKLRALRYLYPLICKEYQVETSTQLFCEPSLRNKTIYDYNVNMLRTTTECMSAILGGAQTISNQPYDHLFLKTNEFGERIARNQLVILKEESHFNNGQHLANDSYYIESITQQIATKALKLFKEIEKNGGFIKQLKQGTIQRKISENAKKEQAQFDDGSLVLLGSNKYPNPLDQMKNVVELSLFKKKQGHKTAITPIIGIRLAEASEKTRINTENQ